MPRLTALPPAFHFCVASRVRLRLHFVCEIISRRPGDQRQDARDDAGVTWHRRHAGVRGPRRAGRRRVGSVMIEEVVQLSFACIGHPVVDVAAFKNPRINQVPGAGIR
jgi:hypothetical protein